MQQRFNIFNQIHKALRALLYDTALTVQQTYFGHPDEAETSLEKIKLVLDIFDKHADHEDQFVLPAIYAYEPSLVDAFEKEHMADHELAEKLRSLIQTFETNSSLEHRITIGDQILHSFIAFMSFNLDHMGKEEKIINQRLWRYYSDMELAAINQRIIASVSQEEMKITSAWMMKGLSNAEITAWLRQVQTHAPESVFNTLFTIAEKELPHSRFRQILEDLTEGAMLA